MNDASSVDLSLSAVVGRPVVVAGDSHGNSCRVPLFNDLVSERRTARAVAGRDAPALARLRRAGEHVVNRITSAAQLLDLLGVTACVLILLL